MRLGGVVRIYLSCCLVLYSLLYTLLYWVYKYRFSLIFTWHNSYLNGNHI